MVNAYKKTIEDLEIELRTCGLFSFKRKKYLKKEIEYYEYLLSQEKYWLEPTLQELSVGSAGFLYADTLRFICGFLKTSADNIVATNSNTLGHSVILKAITASALIESFDENLQKRNLMGIPMVVTYSHPTRVSVTTVYIDNVYKEQFTKLVNKKFNT